MELYRNECTYTQFDAACRKYPANTAIIYLGERFSYALLYELVDRFAAGLLNAGVKTREKVMLFIPNCPQWIIANFAINKIGGTVVPVSPIYTSYEIEYIINDAEVETVICLDTNCMYVNEVIGKTNLKRVIVTNLADLIPCWKRYFGYMLDKLPKGKIKKGKEVFYFKDILKNGRQPAPTIDIDPWQDLAYIMYTGGTTGFPKGVAGNHMGEVSYIMDIVENVFKGYLFAGEDTMIMVNPLFHIMAKGFALATALNQGNTMILMPVPEVDSILEAIQKYKVRWMLGVPMLYRMILENDRVDQYDIRSLKYCYCGGDVLPGEVYNKWREKYDNSIYQVYGSTEVGHVAYSPLDKKPSPKTVGRPLKSRKCRIIDPETLEPVAAGEVGELAVTSPYTIKSYWKKPEETAHAYIKQGDDTYYRMGDFMRFNEDGELEFMERTADIIKCKGYRVSASEVEAVLQDHPAVVGSCAVGIPDIKLGERIKAIVVLKQDAKGVSSADLLRWCRDRLASYKAPSYIEFRDMLPKSKVGKLLRREIRDEERRKLGGN
ncbi:MAG: AMP-dependent synthetase [Syntrophobacterales bacterium CG_4_8_14_3_um_filter_58_8]|nr:MAG: AMP-dependent synthetase [Syntrophaceae bacterium CG2_30_58_14]PIV06738.1 MAG: AMP-dependent synthetase [Syntrophobacterales bacterium CG03_land_8_20_14_0_80_58_14]PJC74070.1 MAG: AMP-dependent synthetase [Syntrophobacterales bacterium CG_4_8_14_3_um_filter_58_8]